MTQWQLKRIVIEVDALVAEGFDDADVNDYFQLMLDNDAEQQRCSLTSLDVDLSAVREQRVRIRAITPPLCPEHGIPDCSPLLNGCSATTNERNEA